MVAAANPTTLVAILIAAHKTDDRDLEREARRRLEDEHGIKLRFMRPMRPEKVVPAQ